MKGILLVGIGQRGILTDRHCLAAAMQHRLDDLVIVEEQGPPAPPLDYLLKNYAAEFKETLSAVQKITATPEEKSNQPFYAALPKYRKRKP